MDFPDRRDVPKEHDIPVIEQKEYLCDGQMRTWGGDVQKVYSPICMRDEGYAKRYLGSYPLLTQDEAIAALHAAVKAYDSGKGDWPTMHVSGRIRHMQDFATRMKGKRDEIVKCLMWEIGKSYEDSKKEFDRTVEYIQETIGALKDLDRVSSRLVIEKGVIGQIRRAPLGVVLCMGPYNYPLNETFTTLIPALIMGNCIIFKPPRIGVLLHYPLLEAFRDSFPPGVVNTVYGEGQHVISPLMRSGNVDVLAFIGSSRVADIIKSQHPKPHRLRSVLGLEAKNAAIVFKDADIDLAVGECLLGALSFNGQRCTALKILFVHRDIAEDFVDRLSQGLSKLKCGMPWDKDVAITPMADPSRISYFKDLIKDAQDRGSIRVNREGGESFHTFFYPAILYPVGKGMRAYDEEQFGPVIPVVPFDDIEEAVDYITQSCYGQQVSIFASDADAIAKLVDPLVNQVCRVNVNCQCQRGPDSFPFTGRKDSAENTLSVSDALRVFSIRTLVAAKETDLNKKIISDIIREHKSNFLSTDFIL